MYIQMPCVSRIVACLGAAVVFAAQGAEGAPDLEKYLDGLLLGFLVPSSASGNETKPSPALETLFKAGFGCDTLATSRCIKILGNPATLENTISCCEWEEAALAPICPGQAHCGHVPDDDCNFETQANIIYDFALKKRCRDVALLEDTTLAPTTTTTTPIVSPSCKNDTTDLIKANCYNNKFSRVTNGGVIRVFEKDAKDKPTKISNLVHTKGTRCTCNEECEKYGDCCHDYDTECLPITTTSTITTTTTDAKDGFCKSQVGGGNICGIESVIQRTDDIDDGFCRCHPDCLDEGPIYPNPPPGANSCCEDFGTTCDNSVQDALLECPGDDSFNLRDKVLRCAAYSHHGRDTHPVARALCPGSYEGSAEACKTTTSTTTTTSVSSTTTITTTTITTTSITTTSTTSITTSTTTTGCIDAPGIGGAEWVDKSGYNCMQYGLTVGLVGFDFCEENKGKYAEATYAGDQACCVCGGGFRTGGITPVTVALTTTATSTATSTATTTESTTAITTVTSTGTSSATTTGTSSVTSTATSSQSSTATTTVSSTATSSQSSTASTTVSSTATTTPTTTYWEAKFVAREIEGTMDGAGFLAIPEATRCNVEVQKLNHILKQCGYEGAARPKVGIADDGSGEYADDDYLEVASGVVCNDNNYVVVGNENPSDPEHVADILNLLVESYQELHNNGGVARVRATVDGYLVVEAETVEVVNNLVLDSAKQMYYECHLTSPSTTATTTATSTVLESAFTCVQDMSANLAGLYVSTNHDNCDRQAMFLESAARECSAAHGEEMTANQGLKCKDKSAAGTFFQGKTVKTCPLLLEALTSMVEHYYQPNNPGVDTFPDNELFECTPSGFLRFRRCKTCDECAVAVNVLNEVVTAYQVDPSFRTCDRTTATSTQTSTASTSQTSSATTSQTSTATSSQTSTASSSQTSSATTTATSSATTSQTSSATTSQTSTATSSQTSTATSSQTSSATTSQTSTATSSQSTTMTSTATTPLTCSDVRTLGNLPWADDAGATCETYVLLGFCDTGITGAGGLSAAEACCECGGGLRQNNKELCEDNCASTLPVSYVADGTLKRCYCDASCERDGVCCHDRAGTCPTPEPIRADGCIDKVLSDGAPWHDSNGEFYTCEAYGIADFCGANSVSGSTVIADAFEFGGMTARFACCTCGGGQESTTTTTSISSTTTSATTSTTTTATSATSTTTVATTVTHTTATNTTATVTTATITTNTATTVTTAVQATFAPGDCRAGESAGCKDCDVNTGACLRCRDGNYLLNGICGDESSCAAAGLIPTGKALSGRACIAQDGLCSLPGCKPTLSSCDESKVVGPGQEVCNVCSSASFLVDGECKYRLTCKGPRFFETGAKCTCRHRKEEGGDIEKNCHRCHTYASEKEGSYSALGPDYKHTFVKCYGCSGGYFFHDGSCVKKDACPSTMVAYQGRNGYKNFCEPEFSCAGNKKQDGPNKGQACECKEKNCAACDWRAGSAGYACTACKRKQYLLDGACVSSPACIASGGVPLGAESHGRICQTATGPNGGGRA